MKAKTFLVLLAAAGLLVAFAWYRLGGENPMQGPKMGDRLFADLPVNQVAVVIIAGGEDRTTLTKGEAVWQVDGRGGYPADFDTLRDTVVKLSRLKVGRSFSGSPESLARLSLLPPTAAEAASRGQQITLKDASGNVLADVILGQTRQTDNGGTGGQYLKMADGDTVFLVDANFRFLKTAPAEWLNKEILDIKSDAVASVACYSGDSDTPLYRLVRPQKGQPAALESAPEGRTVDTAKVDQVLDALAPLTLDDVQAAASPPAASGTRLVYRLYDGREISLFPAVEGNDRYTIRVTARQVEPLEPAEEPVAADQDTQDEKAGGQATATPVPRSAQQLNASLSPWVFTIKKWQFDSFVTHPAALLKAEPKAGEGAS